MWLCLGENRSTYGMDLFFQLFAFVLVIDSSSTLHKQRIRDEFHPPLVYRPSTHLQNDLSDYGKIEQLEKLLFPRTYRVSEVPFLMNTQQSDIDEPSRSINSIKETVESLDQAGSQSSSTLPPLQTSTMQPVSTTVLTQRPTKRLPEISLLSSLLRILQAPASMPGKHALPSAESLSSESRLPIALIRDVIPNVRLPLSMLSSKTSESDPTESPRKSTGQPPEAIVDVPAQGSTNFPLPSRISLLRTASSGNHSLNIFVPSDPDQLPRMTRFVLPSATSRTPRRIALDELEITRNSEEVESISEEPSSRENFTFEDPNVTNGILEPHDVDDLSPFTEILNNIKLISRKTDVHLGETEGMMETVNDNPEALQEIGTMINNHQNINALLNAILNNDQPERNTRNFSRIPSILLPSNAEDVIQNSSIHISSSGHPHSITENEMRTSIENFTMNLKDNPNITSSFSAILDSLGFELDVNNPEIDIFNPNPPTVAQSQAGGKCVSQNVKDVQGVCLQLLDCPALQSLQRQSQYIQVLLYLSNNICRYDGDKVYFCCPFYTFSSALPASLSTLAPDPQRSPVGAAIPGPDRCGKVVVRQGKVIGGEEIQDGEWPWLAAIGNPVSETTFQVTCTGSLITRRHVVTAAHCFYSAETDAPSHVRLGDTNLRRNTRPRHQDFVITGRNFPLYHKHQSINDMALLTLDRDVRYDEYVQPVCLPYDLLRAPVPGDTVTAVGYGRQSVEVLSPGSVPRMVEITVVENSFCQDAYYSSRNFPVIDHRTFCAGGEASMGTCQGDSGGPLHMYDSARDRYVLVGIVKGGGGCGGLDQPSVNTKVSPFLPWIESVVSS